MARVTSHQDPAEHTVTIRSGRRSRPGEERIFSLGSIEAPLRDVETSLRLHPFGLMAIAYPPGAVSGESFVDVPLAAGEHSRWARVHARVQFSSSADSQRGVAIHLLWGARRFPRLFPVMEADLEVHPISGTATGLRFVGVYRPPFGLLGIVADHLVGARLAQATADAFLEAVVRAVSVDIGVAAARTVG